MTQNLNELIDIAETALIVVDMQNDFAAKGGLVDRLGFDIAPIQKAIGPIATVLASARAAGITIIYLKMGFRPDLSDLEHPFWKTKALNPGGLGAEPPS